MSKIVAIIATILCTVLTTATFAKPVNSLLKAAISTPISNQQTSAPIIEASVDEPVAPTLNSSNIRDIAGNNRIYNDDEHGNGSATIAFVHLTNIAFAGEQVELSSEQTHAIDKAIARIQHNGGAQKSVLVTAHADDNGDDSQNRQLSHARASSVANYLKEQGIVEHVIRTHSFGRSQPRDENWTESGRQLNRRVSITLINSVPGSPSI
ncbi:MAG: OmpA family protein [Gammaproteobacteria bacterium]|nr:OmpA family protein [Gammaproteobacteria bacterium]